MSNELKEAISQTMLHEYCVTEQPASWKTYPAGKVWVNVLTLEKMFSCTKTSKLWTFLKCLIMCEHISPEEQKQA